MSAVKLKVCGITRLDQALEISSLGVDALGFVLYPPSPRYIQPQLIKNIISELPPLLKTVGVFVDEKIEHIKSILDLTGLDLAQLHGDESPEYCRDLTNMGVSWIKAFRIKTKIDFSILEQYRSQSFLLDAWSEAEYGGTGKTFNWDLARPAAKRYDILLAGGITPENVTLAIQQIQPYGIDVSSGVESAPGIKSISKIKTLINNIESLN
ncbi:MAG: phosphoribosylanthranilate isomerase [Proteobacteria bacterium]|nr:phosphoribosylanthranilate isomerase [Pseudomonadota bacterium]